MADIPPGVQAVIHALWGAIGVLLIILAILVINTFK